MKNLAPLFVVVLLSLGFQACLLSKGSTSDPGATAPSTGTVSGSSGSTGGVSATPTPSGMYCTDYNGWDYLASNTVFFVPAIGGTTLNSLTMDVHYSADSDGSDMTGATTYSTNFSLQAYTCGSSSSLGTTSSTASVATGINGGDKHITFTFGTPIAIPSAGACGANPYALSFKITAPSAVAGYHLMVRSTANSSTCFAKFSSSTTGDVAANRGYTTIISTSP